MDPRLWFSDARMAPYYAEASGDSAVALQLYVWNAELAAACFELMGHFEVVLRNAIDRQLADATNEATTRIPWFLAKLTKGEAQTSIDNAVEATRARLRDTIPPKHKRDDIVASLMFGFWTDLLGTAFEDVWRQDLRKAFPHSSGRRSDLAAQCNRLRIFRNRLAHPDSLLAADVLFQLRSMLLVAGWINPSIPPWLESVQRVTEVYSRRPVTKFDTVVVPASSAWQVYGAHGVYVCQAGRTFRPVDRIAFYEGSEIKQDVPFIRDREDNVEWNLAEAAILQASASSKDKDRGRIMEQLIRDGHPPGRYQLFWLSNGGDPRHRHLAHTVPHTRVGRGSAFTQRQRYVSLHALENAQTTADL